MIAGLPYDAEVEYLTVSAVQYIDTGRIVSDKTEVEFWFYADQGNSYYIPLFGVYQSDGYLGCQVAYGGAPSKVAAWRGSSTKTDIIGTSTLEQCRGIIDLKNGQWGINGTFRSYSSSTFQSTSTAWYGRVNGISAFGADRKIGYLKIWESGVLVFDAIPVRFTNSNNQSEGAMYDRVSRKLFRNAGTGAFVIGPDVATPVMGLHFFKSQIKTAKDYVQNGLIAMWDGIENVGYGQHDDNATSWADLTGGGANWLLKDANTTEVFEVGSDYVKILDRIGFNGRGHCIPSWSSGDDVITAEIVLDNGDFDASGGDVARVANFGVGNGNTFPALCLVGTKFTHIKYNQYPKFDIGVGCKSISLVYNEQKVFLNGVGILSDKATDSGYTYFAPCISAYAATAAIGVKVKSMRIYGRSLTDAERLANYAVDKRRFNLP